MLVFFLPPHWIAAVASRLRNDKFAVSMAIGIYPVTPQNVKLPRNCHCERSEAIVQFCGVAHYRKNWIGTVASRLRNDEFAF